MYRTVHRQVVILGNTLIISQLPPVVDLFAYASYAPRLKDIAQGIGMMGKFAEVDGC